MNMRIVTIIGARPQSIKAAAVSRVFRTTSHFEELIIHTGQHYDDDMSHIVSRNWKFRGPTTIWELVPVPMGRKPFACSRNRPTCRRNSSRLRASLWRLEFYSGRALVATKLHFPVAHVEAGLSAPSIERCRRSESLYMTDHVSELLFTATRTACETWCESVCRETEYIGLAM